MDERIRQLLQELGTAINESIASSEDVNRHIQRIRDEGYDLYVVLDATIGLNRQEPEGDEGKGGALVVVPKEVQFRINVNDLAMLRGLGIDPTRKVRASRRAELSRESRDD